MSNSDDDPSYRKYLALLAAKLAGELPDNAEEARYVIALMNRFVDNYLVDKGPAARLVWPKAK